MLEFGDKILCVILEQCVRFAGEVFVFLRLYLIEEGVEDVLCRFVIAPLKLFAGVLELLVEAVGDPLVGDPAEGESLVFVRDQGIKPDCGGEVRWRSDWCHSEVAEFDCFPILVNSTCQRVWI